MQFHSYLAEIASAVRTQDGEKLGSLLSINADHVPKLLMGLHDSSRNALSRYIPSVIAPWGEIAVAYVQVIVYDDEPESAFKEHDSLVNLFIARFFKDTTSWALPALYALLRDLRKLAEKADSLPFRATQGSRMEDAARTCHKAFSFCISDRNPVMESRRWGTYYLAGIVMKCYFKIHTISLSRNIIRGLKATPDLPPLTLFPKLHQLTYRYYLGLLSFLNEEYQQADEDLTFAFHKCHHSDRRNQERILTYLIPLRLIKGQTLTQTVLSRFPALDALYGPFLDAVKQGNLSAYDAALTRTEARLFRLGIWYIWEKARDICLRGVFKKVWLIHEESTRIPIESFLAALRLAAQNKQSDEKLPLEEAECLMANMIHKGFIRGYISHERQMVVLSAKNAFPPLKERPTPFM